MAFIRRFFTTGMNSLKLSIAVSLAVAALEVTMWWTMMQRNAALTALSRRSCDACPGCNSACSRAYRGLVACCPLKASPAAELLSHHRRWSDLTQAERDARDMRTSFAFIVGDTVAEDIGMLKLIPVTVFFRLPTRIGAQPLPLSDVLLRVGFQWLLELWTDTGPFVAYAAGRTLLSWRGDTLYCEVTREEVAAALSSVKALDGEVEAAPSEKKAHVLPNDPLGDVLDDSSNPLAVSAAHSLPASPQPLSSDTMVAVGKDTCQHEQQQLQPREGGAQRCSS